MKKKGSLDLSINAIVILVLAITMLGLGLAFTKGMFSKFSNRLDVPVSNVLATKDEQIALSTEDLQITKGKDFAFSVNFYNDVFGGSDEIVGKLSCPNLAPATAFNACSAPQTVPSADQKGFKFIVMNKQTVGEITTSILDMPATRVCTLGFGKASGENAIACASAAWPADAVTRQIIVTIR